MRLSEKLQRQSKAVLLAEALVLVTLIGLLDSVSGWDISLFLFYAVPILLVAWFTDRRSALLCGIACGLAWLWANRDIHPYATTAGYLWAAFNRIVYFLLVAIGGAAIRQERESSRARLEAMLHARELEQEIVRVSEYEQMRIGHDLHDSLCQELVAIDCAIACLKADLEAKALPEAQTAGEIQQMVRDTVIGGRELARGIFPVQMDSEGLPIALEDLVTKTNRYSDAAVTFETVGDVAISDPKSAMHLYRIAQQALSNALVHAHAKHIAIGLRLEDMRVLMTITDDGRGFQHLRSQPHGIGLRTMQYRARLIDAEFNVESAPGEGTEVRCSIPVLPCRK